MSWRATSLGKDNAHWQICVSWIASPRYLLLEALWKDGKIDESISAPASVATMPASAPSCSHLPATCPPCAQPYGTETFRVGTDASVLLAALRESLATTFGDFGLGSALASLQGARLSRHPPCSSIDAYR